MGTLKKLQGYMGQRRILFPLSLILSGLLVRWQDWCRTY